jgi:hypothetical protein
VRTFIAAAFVHHVVFVNYHLGYRCCLTDRYRLRYGAGTMWPISVVACTLPGYGNVPKHRAPTTSIYFAGA